MAYKNSGAMKFNDATDLVIRADPDGTVESVYNLADNTEYVSEYSNPVNVAVKVTNNTASTVNVYWPAWVSANRYISSNNGSVAPAGTQNFSVLKVSAMTFSSTQLSIVSGDAEIIATNKILVRGDCEIAIGA